MNKSGKRKYMIYREEKWMPLKTEGSGVSLDLYDMNKQIISQMPILTDLDSKIDLINEFHKTYCNSSYMMYGKEISYFTLFKVVTDDSECENLGCGVIECLKYVGDIKAIDYTATKDAIEIWVQQKDNTTCLYLFPYDNGIVTVGG